MALNFTIPGFGGGGRKEPAKVEPKPIVKKRYWTPDENDVTLYKGQSGFQGSAPEGYDPQDAWYRSRIWDKKTQKWVNAKKLGDDIYRKNEAGERLMWQPPEEPQKRGGLLK